MYDCRVDLSELNLPENISIRFPDGSEKILNFEIVVVPKEGYHRSHITVTAVLMGVLRSGRFVFSFKIPQGYPHEAPKVKCLTKVLSLGSF